MRRNLLALLFAGCLTGLGVAVTGCNTTEGFGEDVESVGENIDHSAEERGADRN